MLIVADVAVEDELIDAEPATIWPLVGRAVEGIDTGAALTKPTYIKRKKEKVFTPFSDKVKGGIRRERGCWGLSPLVLAKYA